MSDIIQKFKIFSKISEEFTENIKLFHAIDKYNVLFVTNDDNVYGFGENHYGKCGFGHNNRTNKEPEILPELSAVNIKQFIAGVNFVLAQNQNNQVFGWGMNNRGQLGRGFVSDPDEYFQPQIISSLDKIIGISCGYYHSLALTADGYVYGWGDNESGQVGCGGADPYISTPFQLKILKDIKSILCSQNQSFAITSNGQVYSWGNNYYYQLGHTSRSDIFVPKLINGLPDVQSICFSRIFTIAYFNTYFLTTDQDIYFCGEYEKNQKTEYQRTPQIFDTDLKFQSLHSINTYSMNSIAMALSEETVFYLEFNTIKKTVYKTFFEYCSNEEQITFKTIDLAKRFERIVKIGSGAFGKVYQVKDRLINFSCALKMVNFKTHDKAAQKEVLREMKLLASCDDQFVVKYSDFFEQNNKLYIIMELFTSDLHRINYYKTDCFSRQPMQSMSIIETVITSHIMKEILECVQYLHELNPPIIHRDLKPANILVNYKPRNGRFLKLCDFGLATYGSDQTLTHTMHLGTPKYIAPEVQAWGGANGRAKYNTKADVYSLGHIFCDLYGFDLNSPNKADINWFKLEKLIKQMLSITYNERPTCAELLSLFRLWSYEEITERHKSSEKYRENLKQMKEYNIEFYNNYFNDKIIS